MTRSIERPALPRTWTRRCSIALRTRWARRCSRSVPCHRREPWQRPWRRFVQRWRWRAQPSWAFTWVLLASGCLVLTAVFALLFTDYRHERFVTQGVACLKAGLLHAIPTAVISWWILHRGFAVNSIAAGVAVGTLSGLAGVGMLELHCPNFEAPHIMVWHTAVLAVSGAAGCLLAWAGRSLRRK